MTNVYAQIYFAHCEYCGIQKSVSPNSVPRDFHRLNRTTTRQFVVSTEEVVGHGIPRRNVLLAMCLHSLLSSICVHQCTLSLPRRAPVSRVGLVTDPSTLLTQGCHRYTLGRFQ